MSAFPTAPAIEQAQRRLHSVLLELRALAERNLDAAAFHTEWLKTLCRATSTECGRCWSLSADGEWHLLGSVGGDDGEAVASRRAEMLVQIRRAPAAHIASSGSADSPSTEIWCPLMAAGELRGAVLATYAVSSEAAQQGCLRFLLDAADTVERYHLLHDRREALDGATLQTEERRLSDAVHASLDPKMTATTLANEGRLLVGCDRLSIVVRRGTRDRIEAVSGQEQAARRAGAIRALRDVAERCAPLGETIVFPDAAAERDPKFTQALEAYVDEYHVKRFVYVPLTTAKPATDDIAASRTRPDHIGAIVAEYFGDAAPRLDERARLAAVARCGSAALRNVREHQSLFLLPLWRLLGRGWDACFAPGKLLRTAVVAGLAIAAVVALFAVQTDFTAFCRGRLQPVERRRVFAPLDGVVKLIHVKHGETVVKGQPLVELRNTDLDIASADVAGRLTATTEQLLGIERTLYDEANRLGAEERSRLSGERNRLKEEIASLQRQLKLYADKREQLIVVSPIDGEVTTWNAADLLENRPVRQGQQMLTVAKTAGAWELELRVPDDRSGRVVEASQASREPLRVTYSPAVDPSVVREATVVEIQNSAELRGEDGNTVLVRAAIRADELPQRRPGAEVAAQIHCGRRSLGYVWTRDVADFIRSRILFRWF